MLVTLPWLTVKTVTIKCPDCSWIILPTDVYLSWPIFEQFLVWLEIARQFLKFKQRYYVHDLHWAHKSNKTTKVKFTVYWPVINHVTVAFFFFFQLTNTYKTIKALEGIAWNNGNTLILPIIIVQGTVRVYTDGLFSLAMFTLYLITFRADTKVWTPIPYVTRHSREQRGTASFRYRNRAEITVLMCEQRHYLVWFSCRRKSFIVWTYNYEWHGIDWCKHRSWLRQIHILGMNMFRHYFSISKHEHAVLQQIQRWQVVTSLNTCLVGQYRFSTVLGLFQTSCYCRAKLARLQHDTSTTWFQTSNLIQSNRTAVAENKTQK